MNKVLILNGQWLMRIW